MFKPGNHGSTFGGNPLACAAALETLDIIEEERLMTNAVAFGDYIAARFARRLAGIAGVRDIRGKGLMIGIELDAPCDELVKRRSLHGLLINVTATMSSSFAAALISRDQAEQLVERFYRL